MATKTARERFTNAIARLLHRSYAEGLTVQEADDIRDAASQAKRIYEAERDTLRQHNAVLRAECQAGRKADRRWHHDTCERNPNREGYPQPCSCWIAEYDAARAATDAAGAMGDTEVRRG